MTITETTPAISSPVAPAAAVAAPSPVEASPSRTFSIVAFATSIAALVLSQGLLGIVGIVFAVIGYQQEPAGRTFSIWAIVLGAVATFGWIIFAIIGLAVAAPFLAFASM